MENLGLPKEIIEGVNSFKPRDRDMSTPHGKIMAAVFKNLEKELLNIMFSASSRHTLDIERGETHCMRITLDLWCDKF